MKCTKVLRIDRVKHAYYNAAGDAVLCIYELLPLMRMQEAPAKSRVTASTTCIPGAVRIPVRRLVYDGYWEWYNLLGEWCSLYGAASRILDNLFPDHSGEAVVWLACKKVLRIAPRPGSVTLPRA